MLVISWCTKVKRFEGRAKDSCDCDPDFDPDLTCYAFRNPLNPLTTLTLLIQNWKDLLMILALSFIPSLRSLRYHHQQLKNVTLSVS